MRHARGPGRRPDMPGAACLDSAATGSQQEAHGDDPVQSARRGDPRRACIRVSIESSGGDAGDGTLCVGLDSIRGFNATNGGMTVSNPFLVSVICLRSLGTFVTVVFTVPVFAAAQREVDPAFDVVSVKPNVTVSPIAGIQLPPAGVNAINVT